MSLFIHGYTIHGEFMMHITVFSP